MCYNNAWFFYLLYYIHYLYNQISPYTELVFMDTRHTITLLHRNGYK